MSVHVESKMETVILQFHKKMGAAKKSGDWVTKDGCFVSFIVKEDF